MFSGAGPIQVKSVAEELAERIARELGNGQAGSGDRLPSELEMARIFGVSRASVREALRTLDGVGLIERTRDGLVVAREPATGLTKPFSFALLGGGVSLEELFESRRVIEVAMAELAATRADPEELANLRRHYEAMKVTDLKVADYVAHNMAFHSTVAQAAKNRSLLLIFRSLAKVIRQIQSRAAEVPTVRDEAIHAHGEILVALAARDPLAARTAMERHLASVQRALEA
jgi:GntR family transcriptional repressor for pyruvate dehydrogenase complex